MKFSSARGSRCAIASGLLGAFVRLAAAQDCQWVWQPIGASDWVLAMLLFDDGTGPAVYAGGYFGTIGGVYSPYLAKFDGQKWTSVGGGGLNGHVGAMTIHDDGTGPALFVGGGFTTVGGVTVPNVAKWDGHVWNPVGDGIKIYDRTLYALASVPGPQGATLYAGGSFRYAGKYNQVVRGVAELRDGQWIGMQGGASGGVYGLAAFDDGTGPALYAGGSFTDLGGKQINALSKWTGTDRISFDVQPKGTIVRHLWVYDDGSGAALYSSGYWSTIGGKPVGNPARWDGYSWSTVGENANIGVTASSVAGVLRVGGYFSQLYEQPAENMATWDGSKWSAIMPGCEWHIWGMAAHDFDGKGPMIFVGGSFDEAGGLYSPNLAMVRCIPVCTADCDASGALDLADFTCFQTAFANGDLKADCDASASLDLFDFLCFINAFNEGCP